MATEGHGREAKQKAILEAIRKGNTRRASALSAGIHPDTFYAWLNSDPIFSVAVSRAESEAELEMVEIVRVAAFSDWRAAQWYLEHYPASKQDWKRVNEISWRDINSETLLDFLGQVPGDSGAESSGDRMATETAD